MAGMAEWQNGGIAEWQNGRMAEWRNEWREWQNGRMEWWNGQMAGMVEWREWRNGGNGHQGCVNDALRGGVCYCHGANTKLCCYDIRLFDESTKEWKVSPCNNYA
jgi:hypothetical protein